MDKSAVTDVTQELTLKEILDRLLDVTVKLLDTTNPEERHMMQTERTFLQQKLKSYE